MSDQNTPSVRNGLAVDDLEIDEVCTWMGQLQMQIKLRDRAIAARDEQIKKLQAEIIRLQGNQK